ncbi:MAG: hypothetical protein JSV05_08785 [Candidatus Bathyarchaeota archaeon]|nr:MAG: hypothetical protein JSV05_08785 [Candidatus Bathyarchaeota archaeon]
MTIPDLLLFQIINIIVGTIIVGPILWFVGKALVGPEKAKLTDALWIMLLGQVIGGLFNYVFGLVFEGFIASVIAFIIQLLIWLGLIRHFFDTGWGKAFIIALIAVIVAAIVFAVLAMILIGLGILVLTLF